MKWFSNVFGKSSSSRQPSSFQPALEILEDRQVPSTTGILSSVSANGTTYAFALGGNSQLYEHDYAGWHDLGQPTNEPGNPNYLQGSWMTKISAGRDVWGNPQCYVLDQMNEPWLWSQSGWRPLMPQPEGWYDSWHQFRQLSANDQGGAFGVRAADNALLYYNPWTNAWQNWGWVPQGSINDISASPYMGGVFVNAGVYGVYDVTGPGQWQSLGLPFIFWADFAQISAVPGGWYGYDVLAVDTNHNVWGHDYIHPPDIWNKGWHLIGNGSAWGITQISAGYGDVVAVGAGNNLVVYNVTDDQPQWRWFGQATTVSADTGTDDVFYTINPTMHSNGGVYNEIYSYWAANSWYMSNGWLYHYTSYWGEDTGGWTF